MPNIAIVGAGPAGLFAAMRLAEAKAGRIIVFDAGKDIKDRHCLALYKGECARCEMCAINHGIGGAGLFSDGKLVYSTEVGNNLAGIIGKEKTEQLLAKVKRTFESYGIKEMVKNAEAEQGLAKAAEGLGIEYVPISCGHIGSDKLPSLLERIIDELKNKGVEFKVWEKVEDIDAEAKRIRTKRGDYSYNAAILAVGRVGAAWLEELVQKLKIRHRLGEIDIGVRVEIPAELLKPTYEISYEFKARIQTEDGVKLRTFCVCPYGYVLTERYGQFTLVNGHSRSDRQSQNTNFALLQKLRLENPEADSNVYGIKIAELAALAGAQRPIVQRLGDLKKGKRSDLNSISENSIQPTLRWATPGNIGISATHKLVHNVIEAIERLDRLFPGINSPDTLLYWPEIKFHGLEILTNANLETNIKGIYVAGDGAGLSRGIVGAGCSGLLAAEGILAKL